MYRLITCTSLLALALSSGCSDDSHYLSKADGGASGAGTGGPVGDAGGPGTDTGGQAGATSCDGPDCEVNPEDLPPGFENAVPLLVTQSECDDSGMETYDERVGWGEDPNQVVYEDAHFRCEQQVCGLVAQDGASARVLIRPCDMNPDIVVRCDCQYTVSFEADWSSETTEVYRQWDNYGGASDPVLIGSVERDCDGALDEAQALIDTHRDCTTDADCQMLRPSPCLGLTPDHCSGAIYVNQDLDLGAWESALATLEACLTEGECGACIADPPAPVCVDGQCSP